jgi:hypothetical protein
MARGFCGSRRRERQRKENAMASSTATVTLNFSATVPANQASDDAEWLSGLGLVGTDSLTNAYTLAGDGSDELDDDTDSTNGSGGLMQTTDANGDLLVNDGTYTITESGSDDGSIKVTNNETGKSELELWGDPHLSNNAGQVVGSAMDKNMEITLSDGTVISAQPTTEGPDGTSHIESDTVTTASGLSDTFTAKQGSGQGFQNGVSASGVQYNPAAFDSNPDGSVNVYATSEGDLFAENNDTGVMTQLNGSTPTDFDTATDITGSMNSNAIDPTGTGTLQYLLAELQAQQTQEENQLQTLLTNMGLGNIGLGNTGLGCPSSGGTNSNEVIGLQDIMDLFDNSASSSSQFLNCLAQLSREPSTIGA